VRLEPAGGQVRLERLDCPGRYLLSTMCGEARQGFLVAPGCCGGSGCLAELVSQPTIPLRFGAHDVECGSPGCLIQVNGRVAGARDSPDSPGGSDQPPRSVGLLFEGLEGPEGLG
jgi:hypothetical protein